MLTKVDYKVRRIDVEADLRIARLSKYKHKNLDIEALQKYVEWLKRKELFAPGDSVEKSV